MLDFKKYKGDKYDLSIVTVCEDSGELLQRTLESVLYHKREGRIRIEHIVVNVTTGGKDSMIGVAAAERGEIEWYISDVFSDTYEAMNRGIRAVSGTVTYFLPSGDELLDVDLKEILNPIFAGEFETIAAPVCICMGNREYIEYPTSESRLIHAKVCLQGYFVSTKLFRRVGEFDLSYHEIADSEFICRVVRGGEALCKINQVVANHCFERECCRATKLSLIDCAKLRTCYLGETLKKCKRNKEFSIFLFKMIVHTVIDFIEWKKENKENDLELGWCYQVQCCAYRGVVLGVYKKILLWWFEKILLPHMFQFDSPTRAMKFVIWFVKRLYAIS